MTNSQNHEPTPSELPPGTLVVPYSLAADPPYEHAFAQFAASLWETHPNLVSFTDRSTTLDGEAIKLIHLKVPILAWCMDTNATQLCRALIVHKKLSPISVQVWMIDSVEFAQRIWQIQATPKSISATRSRGKP